MTIVIQLIERALRQFDPVDFDALHALTCREANALLGHQRGNARSPERAGMHINICAARRRNDESKALLLIEKFDMAIAQRAGALSRSPLLPRSAAATAAAAKSSAAESPAARRLRLRRGEIDAVHIRHLHSALAIRHIAKHSRPLRKLRGRKTCQCGRMTERIRTIFQGDEAKTFCRIKPFYCCALRAKAGAGTGMIEISHDVAAAPLCREPAPPEVGEHRHFAPVAAHAARCCWCFGAGCRRDSGRDSDGWRVA